LGEDENVFLDDLDLLSEGFVLEDKLEATTFVKVTVFVCGKCAVHGISMSYILIDKFNLFKCILSILIFRQRVLWFKASFFLSLHMFLLPLNLLQSSLALIPELIKFPLQPLYFFLQSKLTTSLILNLLKLVPHLLAKHLKLIPTILNLLQNTIHTQLHLTILHLIPITHLKHPIIMFFELKLNILKLFLFIRIIITKRIFQALDILLSVIDLFIDIDEFMLSLFGYDVLYPCLILLGIDLIVNLVVEGGENAF